MKSKTQGDLTYRFTDSGRNARVTHTCGLAVAVNSSSADLSSSCCRASIEKSHQIGRDIHLFSLDSDFYICSKCEKVIGERFQSNFGDTCITKADWKEDNAAAWFDLYDYPYLEAIVEAGFLEIMIQELWRDYSFGAPQSPKLLQEWWSRTTRKVTAIS
jgi:hypothetical protein